MTTYIPARLTGEHRTIATKKGLRAIAAEVLTSMDLIDLRPGTPTYFTLTAAVKHTHDAVCAEVYTPSDRLVGLIYCSTDLATDVA